VQWEPPGLNGKFGEFNISTLEQKSVFVEVKNPGWEAELSVAEGQAGRAKQPKYRGLGIAFGNWTPLQKCIASDFLESARVDRSVLRFSAAAAGRQPILYSRHAFVW